VYSLPQAPFVPNTVISSSAVNSDFSDIATALTGSIAANGSTPITGQLKTSVNAAPAFASSGDTTTGFGFQTTGEADIYASGSVIVSVTSAGATVNGNETVTGNLTVTGTVTAGSFNFGGTGAIQIPSGTTAQRPASPVQGQIRYNSTTNNYEGYDGVEWDPMSQLNSRFTLSASVQFNLLTVTLLNAVTAAAPTAADPVAITFRDATLANGDPVSVIVNSALSINTNGVGASLGSSNNVPFRFWVVAFNNAGTVVLGLINCSTATQIFPLNEATLKSSTPMSGGATSAGVFYTPNGVTVTNMPFKILGYIEYSAGLALAGTYGILPTTIQLFGSGIKKPGDVLQKVYATNGIPVSTSSGTPQIYLSQALTPSSSINLVEINASANGENATASAYQLQAQMYRGSTAIGNVQAVGSNSGATSLIAGLAFPLIDAPGSASAVTYTLRYNSGNAVNNATMSSASMVLSEIMG
jgi:hypothetical protein